MSLIYFSLRVSGSEVQSSRLPEDARIGRNSGTINPFLSW